MIASLKICRGANRESAPGRLPVGSLSCWRLTFAIHFGVSRLADSTVDDFLTIEYRPDLDVLVGRWLRPIELEEMQRGYLALLVEAEARRCRRWLIDVRRRRNTHLLGAGWMVSTLLPALGPRLGRRTRLAYLLLPVFLRDQDADAAFPTPAYFQGKPFVGERFTEEHEAIGWLGAADEAAPAN